MFPIQNNRQLPAQQPLYFDDFITRNNWKAAEKRLQLQLSPMPATNVYETEDHFVIELVVPGLTQDDLQIDVTDNSVDIRYEPDFSRFEPYGSRRYLHREYQHLAFRREFQLNAAALDLEALEVSSARGVVFVEIPKRQGRGGVALQVPFSLN
ncbi:MAG: Hsp20/alpha crystallin family protein [Saprospiraceae bacterium]|nr:Hsp20/alpha crystallin family protein [Saprospiraceae bacterium]